MSKSRVFGLDLMRSVAILLVVVSHGLVLWPDEPGIGAALSKIPDGVDLFFGISGFLVGSILLNNMGRPRWLTTFWTRWWMRTLPAYFTVLIVSLVAVQMGWLANHSKMAWWRFATFTQNTFTPLTGFFWESWSLTVQQWGYLLLPLFLALGLGVSERKRRLFLLGSMALVFAGWGWRWHLMDVEVDAFWWDVWFRKLAPCRMDAIGTGLLVALWKVSHPSTYTKWRWAAAALGVGVLVATTVADVEPNGLYKKVVHLGLRAAAIAMLVPAIDHWKRWPTRGGATIAYLSAVSYALYLVNLGLIATPMRRVLSDWGISGGVGWYVLYLFIAMGAAAVLHEMVEKPVSRMRTQWAKRPS